MFSVQGKELQHAHDTLVSDPFDKIRKSTPFLMVKYQLSSKGLNTFNQVYLKIVQLSILCSLFVVKWCDPIIINLLR